MCFDAYKPLVFTTGYTKNDYKSGQKVADVKAAIDYDTGEIRYFIVTVNASLKEHIFLTFEEAMVFCDLNDFWVDSRQWSNPKIGMLKVWNDCNVKLENGYEQ